MTGVKAKTEFGLAGWIDSEDARRVHQVAAALEAGAIRVGGVSGISEFTRPKNVWLQL